MCIRDRSLEKDEKIRYLEQQVKTLETQMTVQAEQQLKALDNKLQAKRQEEARRSFQAPTSLSQRDDPARLKPPTDLSNPNGRNRHNFQNRSMSTQKVEQAEIQ